MEPKIIIDKSPFLEMPTKKVTDYGYAKSVIEQLVESAKKYDAVSLAANQLGYDCSIFIMKDWEGYRAYINPRIVYESPELALGTETSLSFPGLAVKITRPYSIRARYNEPNGYVQTVNMEGGPARLFQHEMTHMNGTYFWDDANFLNRNKAIKDWKLIQRKMKQWQKAQ